MASIQQRADSTPSALFESDDPAIYEVTTAAPGPEGSLPLDDEMLREWPSGEGKPGRS
jgi:hypothetical protein